jgi:hypothetical protein
LTSHDSYRRNKITRLSCPFFGAHASGVAQGSASASTGSAPRSRRSRANSSRSQRQAIPAASDRGLPSVLYHGCLDFLIAPFGGRRDAVAVQVIPDHDETVRVDVGQSSDLNTVFTDIAATQPGDATLSGDSEPEQAPARKATFNLWSVLGVHPLIGRVFTEEEDVKGVRVAPYSESLCVTVQEEEHLTASTAHGFSHFAILYRAGIVMKRLAFVVSLLQIGLLPVQQTPQTDRRREIARLISELYKEPWQGAVDLCNPKCWQFNFTQPMKRLLEIGPSARQPLLAKLFDPEITDQIIILLGGVGDEQSVGPIIEAMKLASKDPVSSRRQRIITAADLALTNITVADVIWHHGGGIDVGQCSTDHGTCWSSWWQRNQATFLVKANKQSRRYTNYPNYGIYRGLP